MTDWPIVAVRFALYADLMLLFGLGAFPLYALPPEGSRAIPLRATAIVGALAGIALSVVLLLLLVAGMSGVTLAEIDRSSLDSVLFETAAGKAIIWREGFLILLVIAGLLPRLSARIRAGCVAVLAAAALATLAWGGHGASAEGPEWALFLAADLGHLVAAGAWFGALIAFGCLLLPSDQGLGELAILHRALDRFSLVGSLLVGTIVLTGVVNSWALVGFSNLSELPTTLYGQLLLVKLALFGAMLALAASNRFRLTPALGTAMVIQHPAKALTELRISLAFETSAAVLIVGLVSWLGTLAPISQV